jgi:hypothetical protein
MVIHEQGCCFCSFAKWLKPQCRSMQRSDGPSPPRETKPFDPAATDPDLFSISHCADCGQAIWHEETVYSSDRLDHETFRVLNADLVHAFGRWWHKGCTPFTLLRVTCYACLPDHLYAEQSVWDMGWTFD